MDDQKRIALVRLGAAHPDDRGPVVQFHLADHLGSSNVVVDLAGALMNREEFTPYGDTNFGSFARKRYRFTGMERDEESGLNYQAARYYVVFTGRWMNADPKGLSGGVNSFSYAYGNPTRYSDPKGTSPEDDEPPGPTDRLVTPDDPEAREYQNQVSYFRDAPPPSPSKSQEKVGDPTATPQDDTEKHGATETIEKAVEVTSNTATVFEGSSKFLKYVGTAGNILAGVISFVEFLAAPSAETVVKLGVTASEVALLQLGGPPVALGFLIADIMIWSLPSPETTRIYKKLDDISGQLDEMRKELDDQYYSTQVCRPEVSCQIDEESPGTTELSPGP